MTTRITIHTPGSQKQTRVGLILAPAFGEKGAFTPLGLAYLNGALREAGFTPTYHDLGAAMRLEDPGLHGELVARGFSPDEGGFFGPELDLLLQIGRRAQFDAAPLADRIIARAEADADKLPRMDLALLTLWDSNLYYAAAIGRALRARGSLVVMGGPSAKLKIVRDLLVRLDAADAILVGEGEQRVVELARWVAGGHDLSNIGGATVRVGPGSAVDTPTVRALRIHDLPKPSFEGMPVDDWIPLITSRGCIRDCSFCTEKFNWVRYRQRKVDDVLDELDRLINTYDCRRFEFNDDLINGHVRWLDTFLDALIERDYGLKWTCFMEPYRLNPAFLEKVARAGCTLVKYGVQHLDPRMLRIIGRGDEISEVVDTLRVTADHGIRVSFDIIPGHPGEDEAAHATNMRLLPEIIEGHDLLEVNINPFLLLYGAPVHLNPAKYGVDITFWDETLFPKSLRGEFSDLAPHFIRSYTQDPSRDVVIERTRQLEAVAQRAQSRHGLSSIPCDATVEPLLDTLRSRGIRRVALRPTTETTPRQLLEGIKAARRQGFGVAAIQSTGAPFDRMAFVREAVRRGMSHAVLVAGEDSDLLSRAASELRGFSVPWVLFAEPTVSELADMPRLVDLASRQGAAALVFSMTLAADEGSESVEAIAAAVAETLDLAEARGVGTVVFGLPYCTLPDHIDYIAPTAPVTLLDGLAKNPWTSRIAQLPRCRSCEFSNRCPGLSAGALEREGEAVLAPLVGRPMNDRLPTAFEQLLTTGEAAAYGNTSRDGR